MHSSKYDTSLSSISGLNEYCMFDVFNAQCNANEVVVITEAQYGRMRKVKCIQSQSNSGIYTGNKMDVIILCLLLLI